MDPFCFCRWIIILVFSVIFAIGLWQVTGFEPPSETERWWPDSHTFTKVQSSLERRCVQLRSFSNLNVLAFAWFRCDICIFCYSSGPFVASKDDAVAVVHLVWGIEGMSSDYAKFDPDDFGSVEYDPHFNPTSPEAQLHLLSKRTYPTILFDD